MRGNIPLLCEEGNALVFKLTHYRWDTSAWLRHNTTQRKTRRI